ncbi:MAG: hypothetical protein ACRDST_07080 [Pseudonocardiaceae bacterium]
MSDSLKLASHGEFLGIEVDVLPHQPEHLSFAQAQRENESVTGIERVIVSSC